MNKRVWKAHEKLLVAERNMDDAVKAAYPLGTVLRHRYGNGQCSSVVSCHAIDPTRIVVKNLRTGRNHHISVMLDILYVESEP